MIRERITYDLGCDRCKEIYDNTMGAYDNEDNLAEDAQEDGWFKDGVEWFCPDCKKQNKEWIALETDRLIDEKNDRMQEDGMLEVKNE